MTYFILFLIGSMTYGGYSVWENKRQPKQQQRQQQKQKPKKRSLSMRWAQRKVKVTIKIEIPHSMREMLNGIANTQGITFDKYIEEEVVIPHGEQLSRKKNSGGGGNGNRQKYEDY